MIKGILFAVLFIVLGVSILATVLFGRKASKSMDDDSFEKGLEKIDYEYQKKYNWADSYNERDKIKKEWEAAKDDYRKNHTEPEVKGLKGFFISLSIAILSLGLVICIPGSFHQVEAGTYAVVKRLGKIVDVKSPGTYFDFYMTKKYETYDATVQQVKINTESYSKDGQTMTLELYLQYTIQLDKLILKDEKGNIIQTEGIAGKFGSLASLQTRIEAQCIEKTKAVMSDAPAMTIIQERANYSKKVSEDVTDALKEGFYVNVQDVVLTNIDFTDEFEKSVEDKVVAEQQKQAAITKAEAELEVAKLEAQKKIEEARGSAESQKIIAKASAEAATYNIVELARTLGYEVNETYTYTTEIKVEKSNGENSLTTSEEIVDQDHKKDETIKSVITTEGTEEAPITVTTTTVVSLTSTKYDIVIPTDKTKDFKSLVEDYLQYLAYLEQWNGELPQVVAGDDALSIIVPGE